MYYYFHGFVMLQLQSSVVIECNGVGYEILVAHPELYPIGEEQYIYVYHHLYETEQYFIGFKTLEEKEIFLKLLTVKGIGPQTVLKLFKVSTASRLKAAIVEGDENYLTSLPGIGRKNANQIILDLKGKLPANSDIFSNANMKLAYDGLQNLGFKDKEIKAGLSKIADNSLSVEEYISRFLKNAKN